MPLRPLAAASSAWSSSSNGGGGGGGGDDDDAGERPAGDMATTSPRLFLWQPREGGASTGGDGLPPRRREVTFRDGGARDDGAGKPSTIPPVGAISETEATTAAAAAVALEGQEERAGGGTGRVGGGSGNVLRPDFIQLSYAMKKAPVGGCGGAGGGGIGSEHGAQRGQVRVSLSFFYLLS